MSSLQICEISSHHKLNHFEKVLTSRFPKLVICDESEVKKGKMPYSGSAQFITSVIWITRPQSTNPKYLNDTNNARY
jgi:hypothetical protein